MQLRIEQIQSGLNPLRSSLLAHPVYSSIGDLASLRRFTEHHVFAVWDFMSLLKSLQRELTCVSVPWVPAGTADTRYLINEIVLGEESDVDVHGNRISHFELYLEAMESLGASTAVIQSLIGRCRDGEDIRRCIAETDTDPRVKAFLDFTFDVCLEMPVHVRAAVFTFGREELIPGMFLKILDGLYLDMPDEVAGFKYYIERHIEVDGGHHKKLAFEMVARLCGDDDSKWLEALEISKVALEKRAGLWSAAHEAISEKTFAAGR